MSFKPEILIIYHQNCGCSQIAEAYLQKLGVERIVVESAGLEPAAAVPLSLQNNRACLCILFLFNRVIHMSKAESTSARTVPNLIQLFSSFSVIGGYCFRWSGNDSIHQENGCRKEAMAGL